MISRLVVATMVYFLQMSVRDNSVILLYLLVLVVRVTVHAVLKSGLQHVLL